MRIHAPVNIDPYTAASVRLEMMFGDTALAVGTGFLWSRDGAVSVVTAWHNLTGTSPNTGQPISPLTAARPDRLKAHFVRPAIDAFQTVEIDLYSGGRAVWRTHKLYGHAVDIAAIDIDAAALGDTMCKPINDLTAFDIRPAVGLTAFVIGYPRGLTVVGTPIWKSATIASEPGFAASGAGEMYFLVDAATREGMSGAPVILRSNGYVSETGAFTIATGLASRFVGLYAGRVASADQMEAQLGRVWPHYLVGAVVDVGARDTFELHG